MQIEFHSLAELPADVAAFWEETSRAQDPVAAFAGSREWLDLMTGEDPDAASIVTAREPDGRPRIVVPFMVRAWPLRFRVLGRRIAGKSLRVLKAGGGDLLDAGASEVELGGVWRVVFDKHPAIDGLWFEHVEDDGRLAKLMSAAREGGAFHVTLFSKLPHYRLVLPETVEACMALRSGKSLARIRTKENALNRELGEACRVVELRNPVEWGPYAERIESLMNRSWQAELLGQRFLLDQFRGTAERGMLRSFLLLSGEEPVAFTLYYSGMRTLISGILGYDRRYARYSPGAVLFQKTLEHLYERDTPRVLDFGEGDADYKRQWANDVIEVSSILLVRRRLSLRLLFGLHRAGEATGQAARSVLRALRVERWIVRRMKGGR